MIIKDFKDIDGRDGVVDAIIYDGCLGFGIEFSSASPEGQAVVTVDIHEFKDWFDESYASVFPSSASLVAYVVMGCEGNGLAYDITTRPLATFTTLEGARVYSAQVTGQDCWINVIPLNPETKEQK